MNVHLVLAIAAAALVAAVVLLAVVGGLRRSTPRFALDRAILAAEGAIALGVASGLVQLASTSGPPDGLHVVYGAVAVVALPIGRAWGGLARGPRPLPLAIAGVVLLGVLVRLAQTG